MISRLNAEFAKALNAPDIRERFAKIGVDPAPGSPSDLLDMIRKETELWAKVIKAMGVKPQ